MRRFGRIDAFDQLRLAGEVVRGPVGHHIGRDRFGQADIGEGAHHLMVEAHGARVLVDALGLVQHQGFQAP
ncbi:hypothetical protein D9M70_628890 [compost metagenome]